jgi:DNA-binding PadR family transcriptional regulator
MGRDRGTGFDVEGELPLKPDVFEILLALESGDLHGYGILKAIEARGIAMAASLMYRKLRRLMESGLVAETAERPAAAEDDARRRYYRLTGHGRAVIVAEARRILAMSESGRIRRLAGGGDRARAV